MTPWNNQRIWRLAPFGFDVATFLKHWQAWRSDPQRPDLLHVLAWTPQPTSPAECLAVSQHTAYEDLGQELAAQCWGLLPGLHRLRLNQGQVHLSLFIGARDPFADLLAPLGDAACTPVDSTSEPVIVIGSGIAGAASARALAERGWSVRVLDAGATPAAGASGLPVGLVAPHTSPDDARMSQLSRVGVRCMHQTMQRLLVQGQDWAPSGVQERRLPGKTRKGGAPSSWSTPELAPAASAWTRPDTTCEHALWHDKGAWVKPAALVKALLDHPRIEWQGHCAIDALQHDAPNQMWQLIQGGSVLAQSRRVVVAAGPRSAALMASASNQPPPIQPLRGQLSWGWMRDTPNWVGPAHPVNGNGSFISHVPTPQGLAWFAGSTFDRHRATPDLLESDHQDNFSRLQTLLPDTAQNLASQFENHTVQGWANVRASVPDRLPLVGAVAGAPQGLWTVCALGSRGLTLGVLCGELLAGLWHNEPLALPPQLMQALNPHRFANPVQP